MTLLKVEYTASIESEIENTENPLIVLEKIRYIEDLRRLGGRGYELLDRYGQELTEAILLGLPKTVKEFTYSNKLPLTASREIDGAWDFWNARQASEWAKEALEEQE